MHTTTTAANSQNRRHNDKNGYGNDNDSWKKRKFSHSRVTGRGNCHQSNCQRNNFINEKNTNPKPARGNHTINSDRERIELFRLQNVDNSLLLFLTIVRRLIDFKIKFSDFSVCVSNATSSVIPLSVNVRVRTTKQTYKASEGERWSQ